MDIQYLLLLQSFREAIGGALNSFLVFITNIAVDYYVIVPALIIFWVVDKRKGLTVLGAYGSAVAGNAFLKTTFCIYRPWIRSDALQPLADALPGATGYSFPSGHATSAGGFYGGLIFAYKKHKGLCIAFAVMIALTMFSRNYVGVHTPQDVFIGAITGIFLAGVSAKAFEWAEKNPDKDWAVMLIVAGICALLLPYIYFKQYPMDYVDGKLLVDPSKMTVDGFKDPGRFFGIFLGWFIEKRYVRFEFKTSAASKVLVSFVGGLLFVLYFTLANFFGKLIGFGPAHFILQAGGPVLFMTVYPAIASRCVNTEQ